LLKFNLIEEKLIEEKPIGKNLIEEKSTEEFHVFKQHNKKILVPKIHFDGKIKDVQHLFTLIMAMTVHSDMTLLKNAAECFEAKCHKTQLYKLCQHSHDVISTIDDDKITLAIDPTIHMAFVCESKDKRQGKSKGQKKILCDRIIINLKDYSVEITCSEKMIEGLAKKEFANYYEYTVDLLKILDAKHKESVKMILKDKLKKAKNKLAH